MSALAPKSPHPSLNPQRSVLSPDRARPVRLLYLLVVCLLIVGSPALLTACDWSWSPTARARPTPAPSPGPPHLRFLADNPTSIGLQLDREAATAFTRQTGIQVDVIAASSSTDDRLAQTQLYLLAESADIDIYQIDVIWPGMLADDLLDLNSYVSKSQIDTYFPASIENNTVKRRLVALPYYIDAGLLYYRTDLLARYGFDGPPKTWDDLESYAQKIQDGERAAGNPAFWGFVWQGDAYEGLTCDALEWQASQGGGEIVDGNGEVTVNNPAAVQALARARGWINTISPPNVLTYQENQSLNVWRAGNAAFMRNWSTAWAGSGGPDPQTGKASPIAGKFQVAPLPQGDGADARHAATLGGWQLAVSRFSRYPAEAVEFLTFLEGRDHEKERAIKGSFLPSIKELYNDPDVLAANPYFRELYNVFTNGVARPSTITADAYRDVSAAYYATVHTVLTGEAQPESALPDLQKQLEGILETH